MDREFLRSLLRKVGEVASTVQSKTVAPVDTTATIPTPEPFDPGKDLSRATADALLAASDPKSDSVALAKLSPQMARATRDWTDEQWGAHNRQVGEHIYSKQPALTQLGMRVAGLSAADEAPKRMYAAAQKGVADVEQATPGTADAKGATGWQDWLTNNWQTLLIPAGLIGVAFGGDIGKVLGVMSLAAGGYNLYERYNRLTDPENQFNAPLTWAIQQAAKQVDENGQPAPFSNLDAIAAQADAQFGIPGTGPAVKTGLLDYTFLASHGFKEVMSRQLQQAPRRMVQQYFGPRVAERVAGPAPAPSAFGGAMQQAGNWVRDAMGTIDRTLVGGGKG